MPSDDTVASPATQDSWRIKLEEAVLECRQGLKAAGERHTQLQSQVTAEEKFLGELQERLDLAEKMLKDYTQQQSIGRMQSFSPSAKPDPAYDDTESVGFSFGFSPLAKEEKQALYSPDDDISNFSFKENSQTDMVPPAKRSFPIPPLTPTRSARLAQQRNATQDTSSMVSSLSIQEPAAIVAKDPSFGLRYTSMVLTEEDGHSSEKESRAPPLRTLSRSHTVSHVSRLSSNSAYPRNSFAEDGSDSIRSRVSSSQSNRDLRLPITRTVSSASTGSEMSLLSANNPILERLTDVRVEVEIGLLGKLPPQLRQRGDPVVVLRLSEGENVWWIAKSFQQIKKLEAIVRPYCMTLGVPLPPFPDRHLYTNQTPENVDQRNDMFQAFLGQIHKLGAAKVQTGKTLSVQARQMVGKFFLSDTVDLAAPKPLKGYLLRRSRFGGWKTRFFVINGSFLNVYERIESPPVDMIKLRGAKVIFVEPPFIGTTDERFAFEIIDQHKKRLLFCADTPEHREAWVHALAEVAAGPLTKSTIIPTPLPFTLSKGPLALLNYQPTIQTLSQELEWRRPSAGDSSAVSSTSDDTDEYSLISSSSPVRKGSFQAPVNFKTPVQPLNTHWRSSAGKYDSSRPRRVFGASLETTVKVAAREYHGANLPAILVRCLEVLSTEEALSEEGLFRINGSQSAIDRVESTFEEKGDYDLVAAHEDIHVVATLLKRYLRSLPDSFLAGVNEPTLRAILDLEPAARSAELALLAQQLPELRYNVLYCVIALLVNVTAFQDLNKMSSRNVSIVFSPSLNVPSGVALIWIENFDTIFRNRS